MDAIKLIADGIRAERKEAIEQQKPATKDDVVAAVAPEAEKKTEEPKAEPAADEPVEEATEENKE